MSRTKALMINKKKIQFLKRLHRNYINYKEEVPNGPSILKE